MRTFALQQLAEDTAGTGTPYHEFLRSGSLSAGLYVLPAGGVDRQSPHTEDEVYHVISGRARFTAGDEDVPVEPGSVLFVPALLEHRFHTITEDLTILVVFAPPERKTSDAPPGA